MFSQAELDNQALMVEVVELRERLERAKSVSRQLREENGVLKKANAKLMKIVKLQRSKT